MYDNSAGYIQDIKVWMNDPRRPCYILTDVNSIQGAESDKLTFVIYLGTPASDAAFSLALAAAARNLKCMFYWGAQEDPSVPPTDPRARIHILNAINPIFRAD